MATYTMNQYESAPQKKKKLRYSVLQKTINFAAVPHQTVATGGKATTWAAGDVVEFFGIRPNTIIMGLTVKVVKPTSNDLHSGHTIEVGDPDGVTICWFRTGIDSPWLGYISPYVYQDHDGGMPEGLFGQPFEVPVSADLSLTISHAFTKGIIVFNLYIMEEDRA